MVSSHMFVLCFIYSVTQWWKLWVSLFLSWCMKRELRWLLDISRQTKNRIAGLYSTSVFNFSKKSSDFLCHEKYQVDALIFFLLS